MTISHSGLLFGPPCTQLTLVRFSSVGHGPTLATQPPVQLDREPGTICRRTSDSRTHHTAVLDSR